jgi:prepilin-type processing-associated H-X9-DG protein
VNGDSYLDDWKTLRTDLTGPNDSFSIYIGYCIYAAQPNAAAWDAALGNRLPPPRKTKDKRLAEIPLLLDETNMYYPPYYPTRTYGFSTHFERGPKPAGGNALFGDGHAGWRPFSSMIPLIKTTGFERYF